MKTSIPWLRVLIEGVVIVGSILLVWQVSGQVGPTGDRPGPTAEMAWEVNLAIAGRAAAQAHRDGL